MTRIVYFMEFSNIVIQIRSRIGIEIGTNSGRVNTTMERVEYGYENINGSFAPVS